MLQRIIDGESDAHKLTARSGTTPDLMALGYLERDEFIRLTDDDHYVVTGEIAYSLGVINTPPRPRIANARRNHR